MQASIEFGSKKILYSITRSHRKTLGITITPELEVIVKAPVSATDERIASLVRKKAPWILKQQDFFLGFYPKSIPKKFISGESHLYLGRQYKLKLIKGAKDDILFDGRQIIIQHKATSKPQLILTTWYRHRAKLKFAEIAEPFIQRFKKYNVEPKQIYLQAMPTRWGSCTPKGKIILNPELIKAPKACIEYVIVHELCHLIHQNHSAKFFDLQKKEMPDWERWKKKLEAFLAI